MAEQCNHPQFALFPDQSLEQMESYSGFEVAPCKTDFDFEDKSRFTKMKMSAAQKMQISALAAAASQRLRRRDAGASLHGQVSVGAAAHSYRFKAGRSGFYDPR